MFRAEELDRSLVEAGLMADPALFMRLAAAYREPGRYYHTEKHISECLENFAAVRHLAERPCEIEIAIWFHDAVYDTHRDDNEERSAAWARKYLAERGANAAAVQRIVDMILATRTHEPGDGDAPLMVDVDLGILGASPAAFEAYDAAIRKEYRWVPEAQYRKGRADVLRRFLTRPNIYTTPTFRNAYEDRARSNLESGIARLTKS